MTNFTKLNFTIMLIVLLAVFVNPHITHADEYIAVQSGNWNDSATWGGTVPTSTDDAEIPGGITVTIPAGLDVTRDGLTTVNGILDNQGALNNIDMLENNGTVYNSGAIVNASWFDSYGTFINLPSGTLTLNSTLENLFIFDNQGTIYNNSTLDNEGTFKNSGAIHSNGSLYNAYMSPFTNYAAGVIESANGGTVTNDGTITNDGAFSSNGGFENNGTFTNNASFTNNGTLTNASIVNNNGTLTNNSTISNNGTVVNNASLVNNGAFNNLCAGVVQGSISGNGVSNLCVTDTPTPTPTDTPTPIACVALSAPSLISPAHRDHTSSVNPDFAWNSVDGAQSYRMMIYKDDRSFEFKKRVFTANYHLDDANLLPGKYMWRVRTQDLVCSEWGGWSGRNTLFVD